MNLDFVFPAFTAGAFAIVGAVALIASPLNKNRTARDEAAETARTARSEQQIRTGTDEAARTPDPAGCASACAQILHDHLANTRADYAVLSWAANLCARLGPAPTRDHTDPLWLALPFDIDTPPATIAACLAASASRHRHHLYESDQKRAGMRINTAIGHLDEQLLNTIDGGEHVRALIRHLDRAFNTRWNRIPDYATGGVR